MTDIQKEKLISLIEKGCTDSDVEDFCDENNVSRREAFHFIAELTVPECCKGCKYIDLYPSMPPCPSCSRAKKDFYESV